MQTYFVETVFFFFNISGFSFNLTRKQCINIIENCNKTCFVQEKYFDLSWYYFRLTEAGFPVQLLPVMTTTGSKVGSLQSDWCGIPAGTPVLTGLGDLQCGTLSALTSDTDAGLISFYCFVTRNFYPRVR